MSTLKTFTLHDADTNDLVKSISAAVTSGFPEAKNATFIKRNGNDILFQAESAAGESICREFNKIRSIGEVRSDNKIKFDGRTLTLPSINNTLVVGATMSIFGPGRVSLSSSGEIVISSPSEQELINLNRRLSIYGDQVSGLSDVVRELKETPILERQDLIKLYNNEKGIILDLSGYSNPSYIIDLINECFPNTDENKAEGFGYHKIFSQPSATGGRPIVQVALKGDRKSFYRFIKVCESRGYNTEQARSVIEANVTSGNIKNSRVEGEIDLPGGEKQLDLEIAAVEKNFADHLLNTKKMSGVTIKEKQIDGIKFLFSRNSAIIGDEAGTGKSLMMIAAAHIRLKVSGGRCLIITKNIVVNQLEKEIKGMTGNTSVSSDYNANTDWTVLPYSIFGNDRTREIVTKKLMEDAKAGKITVMILDESHSIKNGDPGDRDPTGGMKHKAQNTTFNIQDISKYVPFVWGASATMVANTADDVYNQLRAVNHPIGSMTFEVFKSRFTHPKDQRVRLEKADELRQTLLDHGAYIQRSKRQVEPNLPNIHTYQEDANIAAYKIQDLAKDKAKDTKPNIMHERMAVADLKTDKSIAKARQILSSGKKVAIFTSFRSTRQLLVSKLQNVLESLKMLKTVFTIDGDQSSEDRELTVSSFKNPDSPVMAIVINLQAGGTGVDFPNILTDVIINDFDWAPSTDNQSINRFFRISSKDDVHITYVVAKDTIDEQIYNRLQMKKQIADAIAILNDQESQMIAEKRGSTDMQLRQIRENRRKLVIELQKADEEDTTKFSS